MKRVVLLTAALFFLILRLDHHPALHLAYVGPGAGFAFLGSFLAIALSLVASFLSLLIWPFRLLWLLLRRRGRFGVARRRRVA